MRALTSASALPPKRPARRSGWHKGPAARAAGSRLAATGFVPRSAALPALADTRAGRRSGRARRRDRPTGTARRSKGRSPTQHRRRSWQDPSGGPQSLCRSGVLRSSWRGPERPAARDRRRTRRHTGCLPTPAARAAAPAVSARSRLAPLQSSRSGAPDPAPSSGAARRRRRTVRHRAAPRSKSGAIAPAPGPRRSRRAPAACRARRTAPASPWRSASHDGRSAAG